MNRQEVFDWMAAHKVNFIVVPFHGGGDEGFVDTIQLMERVEGNDPLEADYEGEIPRELEEALEEPIDQYFGTESWGDGSGIEGEITWDLAQRRVLIAHSIEEFVPQPTDEVADES